MGENAEWEKYELDAHRMRVVALEVEKKIIRAFEDYKDLTELSYNIKSRIKGVSRIVEKVLSKRAEGDNTYGPENLTDVCGFRIITYYQSSVAAVVHHLLRLVRHDCDGLSSPFVKDSLREVDIYTTRPEHDPISIVDSVKEAVEKSSLFGKLKIEDKPTGYSSVHVIVECEIPRSASTHFTKIAVEFQVRSAFEEVWGEVDHKLRYGLERGKIGDTSWPRHLNALKTLVDGCIQYLELIKEQATREQPQTLVPEAVKRSMRSSDYTLTQLSTAPSHIREVIKDAYSGWEKAKEAKSERESKKLFRQAADAFQAILVQEQQYIESNRDVAQDVSYWVRMELAYCLMYTGEVEDLGNAKKIYETIEAQYPNDAVSRFRHGQILSRLRSYDAAIGRFEAAKNLLDNKLDSRVDAYHWVHAANQRNLGYTFWLRSEKHPETPEGARARLADLNRAIKHSREAFDNTDDVEERRLNLNNLVYYGWSERQVNLAGVPLTLGDQEFKNLVRQLQETINNSNTSSPERLDTLMRVLDFIGETDKARQVAAQVRKLLEEKIRERMTDAPEGGNRTRMIQGAQKHLDENELDSFLFALTLLPSS